MKKTVGPRLGTILMAASWWGQGMQREALAVGVILSRWGSRTRTTGGGYGGQNQNGLDEIRVGILGWSEVRVRTRSRCIYHLGKPRNCYFGGTNYPLRKGAVTERQKLEFSRNDLTVGIHDPIKLTLVPKASDRRTLVHVPYLNYIEARLFSYYCHAWEWYATK